MNPSTRFAMMAIAAIAVLSAGAAPGRDSHPRGPHASAGEVTTSGEGHGPTNALASAEALQRLQQGNERFVLHHEQHPDQSAERLKSLAAGQQPFAVILSCSDSRVPPELVFDQGLGDLFTVRIAGNTTDDAVLGSIEYAVEHLGVTLVVVLGHEKCGAVTAALFSHSEKGHIPSLAKPIQAIASEARSRGGDPVHNAVVLSARRVASTIRASDPLLRKRVDDGSLQVLSAIYDIETGKVQFDPPPAGVSR